MKEADQNNNLLLSNFIDRYQKEVSFIDETQEEQQTIDEIFHKAYSCLHKFTKENYNGLDFVITPLSTSLLGSLSKGIMIPDVPIGLIITSKDSKEREEYGKILLQNILCYIGIINIIEDVSLSGLIKKQAKEAPSRLYGYISYDKIGQMTRLCGLDNIEQNYVNWNSKDYSEIIDELQFQYNRAEEFVSHHDWEYGKLFYSITPHQYENIRRHIIKRGNLNVLKKNEIYKEILALASHRTLCEQTRLCTSYYFFNPPLIKGDNGGYSNYGNFVITANKQLSKVWENILCYFSLQLLSVYRVYFQKKIESELLQSFLKSAISAIMSRNMSHNLGSHCMHYTKSALENLSGRLYGHGPEVRGAARLISYIQGRMDFLATLVSGEEYPYGAVNFKSQIVDVLTVDEFSKRHYKASSTREKYKIIKQSKLQTSLETLSSQLDAIIRDRKERNGAELSRVVNATESLINQLENLKLDNADLRTTNFLLENLIKSERFYRESIYDTPSIPQNITDKPFYLYVRYNGELFTGSEHNIIEEETVKAKLSELNIAMPGGLMSTHAFFNIVENLIRNSAKHRAVDLTESALITTIDVRDEKSKGKHRLRFTIFDNKHNANIAYPIIIEQLKGLQILNSDDASINKKSKGFKEMLIAALWLKSNEGEDSFSELLNKIEREKDGATKLSLIKEYAYEIVKVDNHGNDSESEDSNLGLRFYLPYFDTCATFNVNEVQGEAISQGIINTLREEQVKADIVVMDEREEIMQEAYKRFPRLYDKKTIVPPKEISIIEEEIIENKKANKVSFNETLMLYSIMKRRFGDDIIKYQVVFGESPKSITSPANIIYFQRHFNKSQDFSEALNFMYADSVSGGNFTVTLQDNYLRGQSPDGRSLTWKDKYFSYKIIESALTRITLIDERLSDDYNDLELKSKNLRVLNLNPETPDENEIWSGSSFKNEDDYTLFLSIHLGLIEKVINNENNWFMNQYNKEFANNDNKRPERATFFMDLLRRKFGKGKEIFISVHSGRGNYSYDLEHSLKEYPFINLSAIESVFSNSKYLLAQLFYNTIYIGKGEYNQKQS